ncbi:aquaporin [Candidatus Saccharibacteria bacterium]|nr:aquaporin [Candidatus Saccharibacteria bacterium]
MATKKAKKPAGNNAKAPAKTAPKVVAARGGNTTVNITEVNETVIIASPSKNKADCEPKTLFSGFFKKKHEDEDILTIFKSPRIIGAVLGEIIGTMLLALVVLVLTRSLEPIYLIFAFLFITLAVYPISGAHLNPLVTVGMMVTRRVSAIRGVFYIIAQLIGAMLGWLVIQCLIGVATSDMVDSTVAAATIQPITENSKLAGLIAVEAIGAIIYGFAFARALKYKKSAFTFAALVAAGVFTVVLVGLFLSFDFFGAPNSIAFNPALAVAMEAFMAKDTIVWQVVITYALVPLVGGILGFLLADFTSALSGESCDCSRKDCKC